MSAFRNSASALVLAAVLGTFAAAQDGSGIPRDPSQDGSSPRPTERRGSVSVPLPPEGTIGNPAQPARNGDFLPADTPVAGQPGDLPQPSDGAADPQIPSLFDSTVENAPSDLPYGETPQTIPRAEMLLAEPAAMQPNDVEVHQLDEVDPSGAGTLAEADGGLGDGLWAGSSATAVSELLEDLPVATSSPAMNSLARRLLLTGAKPDDEGGKARGLFDIRTRKLAEAGLSSDLVALLQAAGAKTGDARARAEALLLNGQDSEACGVEAGDSAFAIQLRAFCQILDGDTAAAALSADLARVKGDGDAAFHALVAHLADGAPLDAAALKGLTPVSLALARQAKAAPGPAALDGDRPGVLAALARDDGMPIALRAAAGESAAAMGALDADTLTDIFRALTSPKDDAAAQGGALRVQKAFATDGSEARARAIADAYSYGAGRALAPLYASMLGRVAWETPPSAEMSSYADTLTRILLLSGRGDRVADWMNVAGSLGERLRDELAVRLTIAAPTRDRATVAVSALVRLAAASETDKALEARTLVYAGALDALGYTIPSSAQGLLQSSPLMAGSPAGQVETAELAAAARDKRQGEALVRALILLGRGGPAKAHPAVVIEAVAALAAVGLPREAAAIALEAALARQNPGEGG